MKLFSFRTHMGQLGQHLKLFHIILKKKLKITPYCLDLYEHGKF